MGTTSQKLTYLNDTKQLLKQKINNLGGDITDSTTFRQYADKLQTIYDNAPKTEYEEGSNITLENCLKGKLDYEDDKVGYGDTEQESTTGANLLPLPFANSSTTVNGITLTKNNDGTYILNGTSTDTAYFGGNDISNLNIQASKLISMPSDWVSTNGYATVQYTDNSYSNNDVGTGASIDNSKTIKRFAFIIIGSGKTFNNVVIKPMVTNDTTRTYATWEKYTNGPAPNPSYPFPVKCVTGEQEVTVRGSNVLPLINIDKTILGLHIYSQNGNVYLNGTPSAHIYSTEKLAIFTLKAGTYIGDSTVPRYFLRKTSDDSILNENVRTFTITEDTEVYLCAFISSANTYNNQQMYWQLNKGTTLLDYEPYITPITKTLNLGNIELAKIGTYRDYIWTDRSTGKWYKHSKLIKLQLTSDLNWGGLFVSQIPLYRVDTNDFADIIEHQSSSSQFGLCNRYINSWNDTMVNLSAGYFAVFTNGKIYITTQFTTNNMQGWKDFLDNNEVYIIVPLATPTDTEITDTTFIEQAEDIYNIMSLNGTTIIEIAGELPMIMKVRALKNG